MKSTNKGSFIQFLVEQGKFYLYHFTTSSKLGYVVTHNILSANAKFNFGKPTTTGLKAPNSVSLSRSTEVPGIDKFDARLTIDPALLQEHYKIYPVNHWAFVPGDIKQISNYLSLIEVRIPYYEDESQTYWVDVATGLERYKRKFGVPYKLLKQDSW